MQDSAVQIRNLSDGYLLAATVYVPDSQPARGCIIITSAAGIQRRFYDSIARWLSARGMACLTFDFRGMFDSAALNPGDGRQVQVSDWGLRDLDAVIDWCAEAFPRLPLFAISHSMGGHIIGHAPGAQKLRKIVLVGCGSLYWGLQPSLASKALYALLWHIVMPTATALCGRFPGRRLKIIGDLPRGVALQWSKWCRDPNYVRGAQADASGFDSIAAPILSVHFEGDTIVGHRAVHAFGSFFTRAPVSYLHVRLSALPKGANGHFDFFKRQVAGHFWPDALGWLSEDWVPKSGEPNGAIRNALEFDARNKLEKLACAHYVR